MLKKHNQLFLTLMIVTDLVMVVASWLAAYYARFYLGFIPAPMGIPSAWVYIKLLPVILVIWFFALRFGELYSPMRSDSRFHEYYRIFKAVTIGSVMVMAATFFYREHSYSRYVMGLFWVFSAFFLVLSHATVRAILRKLRSKGYNLRYVLIIGTGDLGQTLAGTFARHPESGLKLVGMLTDDHSEVGKKYKDCEVIGLIDDVSKLIARFNVDQIFIALPRHANDRMEKTLNLLGSEVVDIKLAPDILQFMRLNAGVEDFDGIPLVSLSESPMYGWNLVFKRVFDTVFASIFILLWSPVMAVIAILIRLESKGPIVFKQERMSLGGGKFTIYKFRSMREDAEKESGAVWASKGDDRKTKVGEFIRKTSLDELPQLFNVLMGDMSLVGPRPERPVFVEDFSKTIPMYMLRHKMKAGITGWAQVNGFRGQTSLDKRLEFDLYYIENWSLMLDVKILWLTIWRGFVNEHAY
ncbi:MAG: undecaprenyl-phosphate glucose phosphotransferase [Nitrospinae bacterium]|nr:undecaprenyl-phosphate glucose phosphotransferase [Nitrospinota bacterium]MBF0635101.1 undecaprenyl-phosphate glucose phosphotransferase [Nitrospinota bacterium]